jgi:hypothetical protein
VTTICLPSKGRRLIGIYVVDDMLPQPKWPEGHGIKAAALIASLEQRDDVVLTQISWASGLVVAVKR